MQAHSQASSCLLDAAQLSPGPKTPIRTQKETQTKHAFTCLCWHDSRGKQEHQLNCLCFAATEVAPWKGVPWNHWVSAIAGKSLCLMHVGCVDLLPCSWSSISRGIVSFPGPFLFTCLSPLESFPISGKCSCGYKRPRADYEWQRHPGKWTTVFIPDHPGQRWEGFWCHPEWSAGDIIHPEQKNERTVPVTSPGRACLTVLVLNSPARLSSNKMRLG